MNRISGLEKEQAPWHLRWLYGVMRKMFGKDVSMLAAMSCITRVLD